MGESWQKAQRRTRSEGPVPAKAGRSFAEVVPSGAHDEASTVEASMINQLKRHEIQVLLKAGHTQPDAARIAKVSLRTVQRVVIEPEVETVDDDKERARRRIGRPSTYPAILKNIITRNYIDDSKKILRATDLGILLIDALKGHFAFLEYDYTRSLEQQLDDIAEGKAQYLNVVSSIDGQLKKELALLHIAPQPALASNGSASAKTGSAPPPGSLVCPKCKQGTVKKPNGQNFYGCSRYREGCNFSINETIAKKTLTPKQVETLCTKGKTGMLKGFISKQGKPFEAYLTLGEETDWKAQFRFESDR